MFYFEVRKLFLNSFWAILLFRLAAVVVVWHLSWVNWVYDLFIINYWLIRLRISTFLGMSWSSWILVSQAILNSSIRLSFRVMSLRYALFFMFENMGSMIYVICLFLVYWCISLVLPMCVADPDGIPFL